MKLIIETDDGRAVCYQGRAASILPIDQTAWLREHFLKAQNILQPER